VKRSTEQNAMYQAMAWDILKHIVERKTRIRPDGPLFIVCDAHHELIKDLCKNRLGVQVETTLLGSASKPTAFYTVEEMSEFIGKIAAWAATDLGLLLET